MATNPRQLSKQLIHLKTPKVTQDTLDEEVRDMFANRPEGLEYIYDNFAEGDERNNALKRLDRVYPEQRTLKERWDDYINYGLPHGSERYPELWNDEIIEIEKQLPFKDQEEHDIWSDWGSDYRGSADWLDLTDAIMSRQEPNYKSDKADEIIKSIYSKERMPGNEYNAWLKKRK